MEPWAAHLLIGYQGASTSSQSRDRWPFAFRRTGCRSKPAPQQTERDGRWRMRAALVSYLAEVFEVVQRPRVARFEHGIDCVGRKAADSCERPGAGDAGAGLAEDGREVRARLSRVVAVELAAEGVKQAGGPDRELQRGVQRQRSPSTASPAGSRLISATSTWAWAKSLSFRGSGIRRSANTAPPASSGPTPPLPTITSRGPWSRSPTAAFKSEARRWSTLAGRLRWTPRMATSCATLALAEYRADTGPSRSH